MVEGLALGLCTIPPPGQSNPAVTRCTRDAFQIAQTKLYRNSVSMAKGGCLGSVQSNDFAASELSIGLIREPETSVFNGESPPLDFVGDTACAYVQHNRSAYT
jgi:hypothetical protein